VGLLVEAQRQASDRTRPAANMLAIISMPAERMPPTAASLRSAAPNGAALPMVEVVVGPAEPALCVHAEACTDGALKPRATRDLGPIAANDRHPDLASISGE
jgi:hypothetical protein